MFSGHRRDHDLGEQWEHLDWQQGFVLFVEHFDLVLSEQHDLLNDAFLEWLLIRCASGEIAWLMLYVSTT